MRFLLLTFVLLLPACTNDTLGEARVSLTMKVLEGAEPLPAASATTQASVSFTPESVLAPIAGISLRGHPYTLVGTVKVQYGEPADVRIYDCPDSNPEHCLVEITSPETLAKFATDRLSALKIVEGDYDGIVFHSGFESSPGKLQVKGTFSLGGVTYYTSLTGPVTDATQYGYTQVGIPPEWNYPLQAGKGLALKDQSTASIALFFNHEFMLHAHAGAATDATACVTNAALGASLCAGEPSVVGYIGEASPSIERYVLSFSGTPYYNGRSGIIDLFLDETGDIIGIAPKQYYDGTTGGTMPLFLGAVDAFSTNEDGSIYMTRWSERTEGYWEIDNFVRRAHEGTIEFQFEGPVAYSAVQH